RDVGRIGADAGGRDQRLHQRFDGAPDAMRERLAPSGEAGVGLDLDQQGVERAARLAGAFELLRARLGLLAEGDGRDAGSFHGTDGGTSGSPCLPGFLLASTKTIMKRTRRRSDRHDKGRRIMPRTRSGRSLSRRDAVATLAASASVLAAPVVLRAQAPLKVVFAQQRGLLYLPIDMMVSGGGLQHVATRHGLGQISASRLTLAGPRPVPHA